MECNDNDPLYHELAVTRARKTACWLFDTSYFTNRCRHIVDYFKFDDIFLANPLTIREYKVWGYENVHYLPYACDSELHVRPLEHPKTRDVALVGSIRDDRRALVDALSKRGVNLELIDGVFRKEYIDTLASSRIIVNQNPIGGNGLLNMRHFEAQAAGAFLLEQWRDLEPNMDAGMINTATCMSYSNADDIADICCDYLATPQHKENLSAVIDNEKSLFLKYHSYENRCQEILEKVFPNG
jgi:spore maturation protein CgeB